MNKLSYKLLYLFWLLPGYLLFLCVHQAAVFYSVVNTYDNGQSYVAEIIEFDLKQIAAQTNGYVILEFETKKDEQHRQKLSLPVEMAGAVSESSALPVRYLEGAFVNIVIIPTYSTQKGLVLTNLAMAAVGFLITLFIGWLVHRYVQRRLAEGEKRFVIQRVDNES